MSFLQSAILYALPLALLPVVIHLINQYRHRTVKWGAMQFLLKAKRMNKGFARLRQVLILAMRVLAVAALVFAVSRPLASGWVGLAAGGRAETTIVILDRSASMEQTDSRTGESKRETALRKLAELLANVGDRSRVVLIESANPNETVELESASTLPEHVRVGPTSTRADIPAMLSTALDYVTANEVGSADVWICSDLRKSDWDRRGGRWEGLRSGFASLEAPVRFYLLSYPEVAVENLSVTATNVERRMIVERAELVMDVEVRGGQPGVETKVPLAFVVNGTRTVMEVSFSGGETSLQGHTIPLDESVDSGWGRVELPTDENAMDDRWWFVFAETAALKTAIVSDDAAVVGPMEAAVVAGPEDSREYSAEISSSARVAEIDWKGSAMILWQAALPAENSVAMKQLERFVDDGKSVVFFPPEEAGGGEAFGYAWGEWIASDEGMRIGSWRQDAGLLADTQSGEALPLGETRVFRYRKLAGDGGSPLAKMTDGSAAVLRANERPVFFCGVLPKARDSSLARDGVAFYAMLHRALETGAAALSGARMMEAGQGALGANAMEWDRLNEDSSELEGGAFSKEDELRAINRPTEEDEVEVMDTVTVDELFEGLEMLRIDDVEGEESSLVSEVWRAFLIAMALALVMEAILCLPEKKGVAT